MAIDNRQPLTWAIDFEPTTVAVVVEVAEVCWAKEGHGLKLVIWVKMMIGVRGTEEVLGQ